ncbi:MAG TPA: HAMP domain-containing sensor histidine kinase [Myxococcaceae bacterium]|nr:HAMP domain-containing sensor histidine kinase [Myxococcaceae bacterium]
MSNANEASGIALLCDAEGRVTRIIRDDLGLGASVPVGRPFILAVHEDSVGKAFNFLLELRQKRASFDWELNLALKDRIEALFFAGSMTEEGLLLVGTGSRSGALSFLDEIMLINNEQANQLRQQMKESLLAARQRKPEVAYMEELSRLNNELARLQRDLAKNNSELARLNELKNEFLGMAAHDLRNPLGIIMNYSTFLKQHAAGKLPPEKVEMLSAIEKTSHFMLNLIENLLDISLIEAGKLHLDLKETDLAALIQSNVGLNGAIARKKDIGMVCEVEPLPRVYVDRAKLEQVLDNLLSNAVKYSHSGTTVRVDVKHDASEGRLRLTVTDQGQGIPPDEVDKLFQPFQRTSVKSTAGERSTGLGLAIVKKIVEGHQGRISVESKVGEGTAFTVELPLRTELPPDAVQSHGRGRQARRV